jgi:hypothetical protein
MRRPIMVGQGMIQIKIFAVQANQHFFAEERYDPERFKEKLDGVSAFKIGIPSSLSK